MAAGEMALATAVPSGALESRSMPKQLLHLVFGGELMDPGGVEFADPGKLDIVGIFPDYRTAYEAWRGAAQKTVDDAHVRYFIVHLHRLIDPRTDPNRA
jgi:acyl-CoA-binding protein